MNMNATPVQISQHIKEDIVIITVKGRIDAQTAPEFRQSLKKQTNHHENKIIINMAELNYLSSAGIREFKLADHQIKNKNTQIVLCKLQDFVKEIFKVTRLDSTFEIFDTEEIAFEHFNSEDVEIKDVEIKDVEIKDVRR